MAFFQKIFQVCPQCKGSKVIVIDDDSYDSGPPQELECPTCGGSGKILWGKLKVVQEEEL